MSSISCSCGEEGLDAPEPSFVWDSVVEKIEDADTIVICGHVNPDGDAIGSTLRLVNPCAGAIRRKLFHVFCPPRRPFRAFIASCRERPT